MRRTGNCSLAFEGCMSSGCRQSPEYLGKQERLVFNGIGHDATAFESYDDGPAHPRLRRGPLDPLCRCHSRCRRPCGCGGLL